MQTIRGGSGYSNINCARSLLYKLPWPILDKIFELCPFMQTVLPYKNYVEDFS